MWKGRRAGVNSAGSAGPVRENRAACAGDWSRGAWWEVESLRRRPHATGRREVAWRTTTPSRPCAARCPRPADPRPSPPAPPREHGGFAPPGLEERSEGFVSAIEFQAVRSEQQGPPAVDGLHGAGAHASAWPWGGRGSGIGAVRWTDLAIVPSTKLSCSTTSL